MLFTKGALLGIFLSVVGVLTYWAIPGKMLSTIKMSLIVMFLMLAIAVAVTEMAVRGFSIKPPASVARFFVGVQVGIGLAAALTFWGVGILIADFSRRASLP